MWAQSRHSVAFGAKFPCQVGEPGTFGYVQLWFCTAHSGATTAAQLVTLMAGEAQR